MTVLPDVLAALARIRTRASTEADLQAAVGMAFKLARVPHEQQVRISPHDRLDFLAGDVAVELKVDGSAAALLRQLDRYAAHERVGAIVVVSTRARHLEMPAALRGKPVHLVSLLAGGLL